MKQDAIFHPISWISHKAKRPVKSVPAAEIMAASEELDDGKVVVRAYKEILNMEIDSDVCVDSKDLFTSFSTQRNSIDRSIRPDVGSIRFEFQTGSLNHISWITGRINLPNVLTKKETGIT